jgi:peptidoglycan hydrolase-like protein with peptidoglycan-binding domain
VAPVSYLRQTVDSRGRGSSVGARSGAGTGGRGPGAYLIVGLLVVVVLAIAGAAVMLITSKPSLSADPVALARVDLPLGGGRIQSVSVVAGPTSKPVPVEVRGRQIWPRHTIRAGERLSIEVVVRRPSSIAWLTGSTHRLQLNLTAPGAALRTQYTTVQGQAPLRVRFSVPVSAYAYGAPGRLQHRTLSTPQDTVEVPRSAAAGSVWVSAVPRTWEAAPISLVSWFPAGTGAAVVASPAPGSQITASTPITLTFNKPVSQALGGHPSPPVSPNTQGVWHQLNSHTIVFRPEGYGYGLGAKVNIGLPSGVRVVGGAPSWTVPAGSTVRLQQVLGLLGYLPLHFNYQGSGVALTPQAQEAAAVHPPAGSFSWRFGNVPSALRSEWAPGAAGVMTRGAVMAFENDEGLAPDGDAGPSVWRALIGAVSSSHVSSFGYTFVSVDKSSQNLSLWHNGHTVMSTAVNTGIASAPTASGTFAVFEHLRDTTMSGTNPDGSHYSDPNIQYVSYFNGGDALHAFTRAQYGFPQSLGCVEMALGPAGQVWPYTPIGTLVHVA